MYAAQQRTRDFNHSKMWELLQAASCADCKIEDSRVLEFDHRPNEKKSFSVSRAVAGSTRSWELIKKEIDKCDIVCANCHRIRTMTRGNYKRYKSSNMPL